MKKILSPISIGVLILMLALGSLAHLMYGSCQTTKYHYMVQRYWMPRNMPKWALVDRLYGRIEFLDELTNVDVRIYKNYTGYWKTWHRNGYLYFECPYLNGLQNGTMLISHENGKKEYKGEWVNGERIGVHFKWHSNGVPSFEADFVEKRMNTIKMWYENGNKQFFTSKKKNVGKHESWYENGNLELRRVYKDGKTVFEDEFEEDGAIKRKEYYDAKGDFQRRELFEKGKLVKTETEE